MTAWIRGYGKANISILVCDERPYDLVLIMGKTKQDVKSAIE